MSSAGTEFELRIYQYNLFPISNSMQFEKCILDPEMECDRTKKDNSGVGSIPRGLFDRDFNFEHRSGLLNPLSSVPARFY